MQTGFDLSEFDKMINKFERLKEQSISQGKRIVNSGAKIVLDQQRIDAPKRTGKGSDSLKVTETKLYKTSVYAKIGIHSGNWEVAKGLWFQHFGYHNNGWGGRFNGKFVAKHVGWMNKSFDNCKSRAYQAMYSAIKDIDFKL